MSGHATMDVRKLYVAAILALALGIRLYNIGWSFSNNGIDEGIMLQRSLLMSQGHDLYTEIPCDQAPLAFLLGSVLSGDVVGLRVLQAIVSVLAIAACMEAARRVRGDFAMIVTGLLLAVDFAFVRESRLFSLDGLSSFFIAFAVLAFVLHLKRQDRTMLVVAGVLVGLSAAFKLHGAVALVGILVFLALEHRNAKGSRKMAFGEMATVSVASAVPMVILLLALGPSDMLDGMLFDQGHREFDLFLKLSIAAYFGLNLAYALPLAFARSLWNSGPEARFLLSLSLVLLIYMVLQPLTFLHHMVLLSPPLAVLAGVLASEVIEHKIGAKALEKTEGVLKRARLNSALATAFVAVNVLVSGSLCAYGLAAQGEPLTAVYGDFLQEITDEDDWVICGDPLIASYADRAIPPEVVNVAYRRYPDLTLVDLETAIAEYDVAVVVVCYRLNEMEGLTDLLTANNYTIIVPELPRTGENAVLDLFQEGLGEVSFAVRADIAEGLRLADA